MATDVTGDVTGVQASPTEQTAPDPQPSRRRRPYQLRFLIVYGILAAVLGAGIAGIVMLVGTSVGGGTASWSTWKPTKYGAARVSQIAQHVSKAYRLTDGGQLLDVIAKPPAVQNVPIKAVAVRNKAGNADEVSLFDEQNSLMLVLCGGGTACAISKGTASVERGRLVRREALELALYTFKYVGNVKYIVAFMPPKKGSQPLYALYFHRDDFDRQLKHPLAETLSTKTPKQNSIPPLETARIDKLTEPHTFKFSLQQAQQGDAILVLDPPV
jgi:hypothetical protein